MDLKHSFLLAMPNLTGDYFAQSLTYICQHTEAGAMGIIVNRPGPMTFAELYTQLGIAVNPEHGAMQILQGGPVQAERGFVLHDAGSRFDDAEQLADGLSLSSSVDILSAIAADQGPQHYLVALGYAGWGAGQLEEEMANNVWLTAPADRQILFELPYDERLQAAASLLGIDFRLIARPGHA